MDLGSNVLWTARFEGGTFAEWTGVPGGDANADPSPPGTIQVSTDNPHDGSHSARLTIDAPAGGAQQNTGLNRRGGLPVAAYYSAWTYIPRTLTVGGFWVIFKFRQRANAADATSDAELIDIGLVNDAMGQLVLSVVDHRQPSPVTLPVAGGAGQQVVPAGGVLPERQRRDGPAERLAGRRPHVRHQPTDGAESLGRMGRGQRRPEPVAQPVGAGRRRLRGQPVPGRAERRDRRVTDAP